MAYIRAGRITVVVSSVVVRELAEAPEAVRQVLATLPAEAAEPVAVTEEVIALRDAYLNAGILGRRWADEATHVALATVARADAIVSWNFRHIVRLDKMRLYNQVNLINGYGMITIISPAEVLLDEDEPEE